MLLEVAEPFAEHLGGVFFDQCLLYVLTAPYRIYERVPVSVLGCFEGNISVIEAPLHILYLCGARVERAGKDVGGGDDARSLELLLLPVQAEKELPLTVFGADLHHAPRIHEVFQYVGAYPEGCVCRESRPPFRVVFPDGADESHVPFLDEVEEVDTMVLEGYLDDESEICEDHFLSCLF